MTTALQEAFPGTNVSNATVIVKLAEQGAIVVDDLDAVQAEDFSIQPWDAIISREDGGVFTYDPADTTTAHDGINTVVVSGRRYIRQTELVFKHSAKSAGDTSPPGSPSLGDRYVIGAAPSGDWASNAKNVATWTSRGWHYQTPERGMWVYVLDEDTFYHYSASDTWVQGFPISGIADGSLSPLKLRHPLGVLAIEEVRNWRIIPAPADGTAYIVSTTPAGVWVGFANYVAYVDNGDYVLIAPFEGATVYNKATQSLWSYKSGTWQDSTPSTACPNYSYATFSGTNLGNANVGKITIDTITISGTSGNRWIVEIEQVDIDKGNGSSNSGTLLLQLFLDSESVAKCTFAQGTVTGTAAQADIIKFSLPSTVRKFSIPVPDNASHDIKITVVAETLGGATIPISSALLRWSVTEMKPTV